MKCNIKLISPASINSKKALLTRNLVVTLVQTDEIGVPLPLSMDKTTPSITLDKHPMQLQPHIVVITPCFFFQSFTLIRTFSYFLIVTTDIFLFWVNPRLVRG